MQKLLNCNFCKKKIFIWVLKHQNKASNVTHLVNKNLIENKKLQLWRFFGGKLFNPLRKGPPIIFYNFKMLSTCVWCNKTKQKFDFKLKTNIRTDRFVRKKNVFKIQTLQPIRLLLPGHLHLRRWEVFSKFNFFFFFFGQNIWRQ